MKNKLKTYQNLFEVKTKDDGTTYTCLKSDNKSDEYNTLLKIIYDKHNGTNFAYTTLSTAVDNILTYLEQDDTNTLEDYQDNQIYEDVNNDVNIYHYDLLKWVSDNLYNMGYVDEAIENGAKTLSDALMQGQYEAIREIYQDLINILE